MTYILHYGITALRHYGITLHRHRLGQLDGAWLAYQARFGNRFSSGKSSSCWRSELPGAAPCHLYPLFADHALDGGAVVGARHRPW